MTARDFPEKLSFAMKALSVSRTGLAAELKVDKSVVGRWISGVNKPTGHNLTHLSMIIAARRPGFTELDWDRDPEAFRQSLGVAEAALAAGA
jgi:hypothetical protein